tara:strand:- start:381 stop:581 length:201 start_codon:yes stop_codon:yes gene_type:complete
MNPKSMEKAMLKNMVEKTGRSIDGWAKLIKEYNFIEYKNIVKFLKDDYSVGHFYAKLIAKKIINND